jgi:DNA-binding CsgD family transcriptional regulator
MGPFFEAREEALRDRMGSRYGAARQEGEAMDPAAGVSHALKRCRARPSFGWESLTPAESRVVELAATGLSNPQIAAKLFVGAGTVKTHLAHAYTKLGVNNRAALAAMVASARHH